MKVLGLGSVLNGGTVKRITKRGVVVDVRGTNVTLTLSQVERLIFRGFEV